MPPHKAKDFLGFGGWFRSEKSVAVQIVGGPAKPTLSSYPSPNWNKFGSLWQADAALADVVDVKLTALHDGWVALHGLLAGVVAHPHLEKARPELLPNMYQCAPEALFVTMPGAVHIALDGQPKVATGRKIEVIQKSCNRCGRYLPINTADERNHLSFSNHCVAANLCPCKHATFSKLTNRVKPSDRITLHHGYQLECRFCKKFEVNAAHNPQRTPAQTKEDGARRRAFELLIEQLEGGSPLLRYRHETGHELQDDIFAKFGGRCFKCGIKLNGRDWHLDHTRPLALLWPVDATATALCGPCNSAKHDRPPSEFYTREELAKLAKITGISLAELRDPKPNLAIIQKLSQRLDWFFDEFLCSEEMTREHDGKIPGELLLKALYKALSRSPDNVARLLTKRMQERVERANEI